MTGWLDASGGHCGPKAAYGDFGLAQFLQISFAYAAALVFELLPNARCDGSTVAALSVYALGYAIVPESNSSRGNHQRQSPGAIK